MVHDGRGAADNGSMVRIDIFHVEGQGYYYVPIYISDTLKPCLPNKAALAFKSYENWPEMREQDFLFSLYPNDCLRVTGKSPFTLTNLNKLNSTLPEKIQKKPFILLFFIGEYFGGFD
jgi:CRISPR-associated endonuclease Csn1